MLKERGKRPLALIVAIAMMLSMFPATAFAGEASYEAQVVQEDGTLGQSYGKEMDPEGNGSVLMKKSIKQVGTDAFDITLKVATKEEIKQNVGAPDAAVVLVMDYSGSMKEPVDSNGNNCTKCGEEYEDSIHQSSNNTVYYCDDSKTTKYEKEEGWSSKCKNCGKYKTEGMFTDGHVVANERIEPVCVFTAGDSRTRIEAARTAANTF